MKITDLEQRGRIFELVSDYVKSKTPEKFIPGNSWIRYAGRVFESEEYITMVDAVLDGWITSGKYSEEFEYQLSKYLGIHSSLIVNSGSSANLVAMSTLTSPSLGNDRLKFGDEVITVAAGFPTTVNPIIQNGAVPVFVDVEEDTYNINVCELEEAISEKTKALMIAHTLGNPFDLSKIVKIAKENSLYLIEDNCDALGATFNGKKTGTFGDLSTLSFYPAHHMTMGEGGAVNTNNPVFERIARSFRDWGRDCYCETGASDSCGMRFTQKFGELPLGYDHKYVYSHVGYNLKATDIQAAIGVAQLKKVDTFIERRKRNFSLLYRSLKQYDDYFIFPRSIPESDPSWFAFPLTIRDNSGLNRKEIVFELEKRKIMTRHIFAGNLVKHPAYLGVKKRIASDLKVTNQIMNKSFFIGVYPGITDEMIEYVATAFDEILANVK